MNCPKNLFSIIFIWILSANLFALDIDEKLTIRFLKLSNSKKTVLINRGAEDGLVVGDHAKFFITSGIIARGVVEKVSPSRSIWSIYRIVSNEDMVENKVLNLKIASPVKVTNDPSKSLKEESTIEGMDKITIPKDKSESEITLPENDKTTDEDRKEMEDLGVKSKKEKVTKVVTTKKEMPEEIETTPMPSAGSTSRSWEVFGTLSMNSMSGTIDGDTGTSSTSSAASELDLSIGLEKYFFGSSFFKDVSLFGIIYKRSMEEGDKTKTTSDWFQYGLGLNYHFYNPTYSNNKIIGYFTTSAGLGTSSVKSKASTTTVSFEEPKDGTNNFFSVGVGAKYILGQFGARAVFDYNMINESYVYSGGLTSTRSLAGPRIQLGLSYRF